MNDKAWLVLIPAILSAAWGDVEMKANMCTDTKADVALTYTNKNDQPWDMQGFVFSLGATSTEGKFGKDGKVQNLILPGMSPRDDGYHGCGTFRGPVSHLQLEAKTGYCNEIDPPEVSKPMQCAEINTAAPFYDAAVCVKDSLGILRGDGYGGALDSYKGQTQIQVRLPAATWTLNGKTVKFDPQASMGGPFYMMSMAALQEYMYVDMQFMLALGASKSGAGLVDAATGTSLYKPPLNAGTGDDSQYGSFGLNLLTYRKIAYDYPKYIPPEGTLANTVSNGSGPTPANSPQQINSGMLGAMNLWWYLDAAQTGQDLCFKQFMRDAQDKTAGLKVLISGYENGYGPGGTGSTNDFATQVLPAKTNPAALAAKDITPYMKPYLWDVGGPTHGKQDYITNVFTGLDVLVQSGSNCSGEKVYDAPITKQNLMDLYFGTGGSVAKQGTGGLLWHFNIGPAQRQSLFDALECAYKGLEGKAPSTQGQAAISFRYDFLTVLRVAKTHFTQYLTKFSDKPTPADPFSSDFSIWVVNHSKVPCENAKPDNSWPVLKLAGESLNKGEKVEGPGTIDDRGIKSREFTTDDKWLLWSAAAPDFSVPPTLATSQRLWYRVTDSCGNATIEEVKWSDGPPLDKVVATPPGGPFFGSVKVTLDVPSVTGEIIYYTIDGSTPTSGSLKYDPAAGITISTDIILKAIATKAGSSPSPVESWTFTKQLVPVTKPPTADPPGKSFTTLDPDFTVTLNPGEAGSAIFFTTDNSVPDTLERGTTKKYVGPITVSTTVTIKAVATKAGQLGSAVMVETYTETQAPKVATPVATPPGAAGTSPFTFISGPLSVSLSDATAGAAIQYRLDDGAPVAFSGALSIAKTTTLKAFATKAGSVTSDTLVVQFVFTPPVSVSKSYYQDLNGDGRIETVILEFEKDLPTAPEKLGFKISDESGQTNDRAAGKAEIAFASGSKSRVVVTLADPFPYGITSVTNRDASGQIFKQDDIPLLDNAFRVDDSVPPVVSKATVQEPDSLNPEKRIMLTVSEATNMPLTSQTVLVFKHEGVEAATSDIRISRMEKTGDRDFVVYIDGASPIFPIVGDSIALVPGGEVKDIALNAPSRKTFKRMDGIVPKPKPTDIYVTFPNSTKDKASDGPSPQGDVVFIPVDKGGNALSGSAADGKCPGTCFTGDRGVFVGPVFHIETAGPVAYEFQIFNNVGEFLARGKGRFDENDLKLMERSNGASGVKYVARVIWTGQTTKGGKAGTGAYILQSVLNTDKDTRTGAPPASTKKRVVFGMLRSFKGS
ncbi:MAG: S-layer protein [Fibrobacteres bacterium]|nr:S-layer protein [Fibrobacterota bacterium]